MCTEDEEGVRGEGGGGGGGGSVGGGEDEGDEGGLIAGVEVSTVGLEEG